MVSDIRTTFAEGTIEWKPEPEEKTNRSTDEKFMSYQLKIDDRYYRCNVKQYNAVNKDEAISFTYSTTPWQRDGKEGFNYKIHDIGGPATLNDTVQRPNSATDTLSQPRTATPTTAMIGNLRGEHVGAIQNRAKDIGIALGIAGKIEKNEEMKAVLMNEAYLDSWFQAQPIPSADEEPVPLQDDPPKRTDEEWHAMVDSDPQPPWEGDEPPDDPEQEQELPR